MGIYNVIKAGERVKIEGASVVRIRFDTFRSTVHIEERRAKQNGIGAFDDDYLVQVICSTSGRVSYDSDVTHNSYVLENGYYGLIKSAEDFEHIIPTWIRNYADNNDFDAGIRSNRKLVGMVGLQYIDWKNSSTSIGHFLSEEAQGQGIITRSVSLLYQGSF